MEEEEEKENGEEAYACVGLNRAEYISSPNSTSL